MNCLEVCSEKLLYDRGHPTRALVFEKLTFLEFYDMLILKKLHFAHIWSECRPRHSKRLSGGTQEGTSGAISEAISLS